MFDTPDLAPVWVAPYVALWIAGFLSIVGLAVGLIIEKKAGKRPAWYAPLILALILILVPLSCCVSIALGIGATSPAPWLQPTTSDIAGDWMVANDLEFLNEFLGDSTQAHQLVFEKDGAFRVSGIPFWRDLRSPAMANAEYVSGSGTWRLAQLQGTERLEWVIYDQFHEINGHPDERLVRFGFEGHLPPIDS